MKCSKASSQVLIDLGILCGAWVMLLASLLVLGRAGYGTGLAVATMGEDQNWIALLQGDTAHGIANNFWKIDGRNPLSPWFYIAARPLISFNPYGLAFLQYAVGLSLALATYALLRLLGGRGGRWFALSVSTIVAVNQANGYFDHIIWNFQLALCFTIVSVVFYLLFLRSKRRWILAYGVSLCFWCLSFYTYTLQSGAVVAIALCQAMFIGAVAWRGKSAELSSVQLIGQRAAAIFDLVPYVVTFIVFLLTWVTTTPAGGNFPYAFSFGRLISSLRAGLFHQDIGLMVQVTRLSPFAVSYVVVGVFLATALTCLVALGAPRSRETPVTRYLFIVVVILAIALPTLLVEAGGADWPPGSRWRMIYQMTTPVLMLSVTGVLLAFFRSRFNNLIFGVISCVVLSTSLVFSFAYNERQISLTRSEAIVRATMHSVIAERGLELNPKPLLFVLEIDDSFQWLASESLRSVYMKTWFPGINVEYRILASQRYVPSNPARLTFAQHGIDVIGSGTEISYDRIVLLHASGNSVTRRFNISRQEAVTHNADWQVPEETIELK